MVSSKSGRRQYADIFKALCMILVIIGHVPACPNTIRRLIYSFHMPAFFLIYGAVYSIENHADRRFLTKQFVLNKIRRLIIPCYIWALIYTLFSGHLSLKSIIALLIGNQKCFIKAGSLSSLWFLPAMFAAVIIFEKAASFIYGRNHGKSAAVIASLAAAVISALLPQTRYGYPWSIDVVPVCILFIMIGFVLKPYIEKIERMGFVNKMLIFITAIAACYIINVINLRFIQINNADMASRNYGNCILYFAAAAAGSSALIAFSSIFEHTANKIVNYCAAQLSYIGKHTLMLLVLHKPLAVWLSDYLSSFNINNLAVTVITSTATLLLITICMKPLNKYVPYLFGES